jgi:hypothetical protein
MFENFADDQNCPVGKFFVCFGAAVQVKEAPCSTFGFFF